MQESVGRSGAEVLRRGWAVAIGNVAHMVERSSAAVAAGRKANVRIAVSARCRSLNPDNGAAR
jgi:hypothetical protein